MDGDLDSILGRITHNSKNKDKRIVQDVKPGNNLLELNPYWKNGGSGIPPKNTDDSHNRQTTVIGDGGLSWWMKALQRCKENAAAEGISLEEAAAERYESLDFIYNKINEAKLLSGQSSSTRRNRESFRSRSSCKSNDSDYSRRRYDNDRRKDSDIIKREDVDKNKGRYNKRDVDEKRSEDKSHFSRVNYEKRDELQTNLPQRLLKSYPSSSKNTETPCRNLKPAGRDDDCISEGRFDLVPKVKELSVEEKNKLSAKLLRAEMMGDKSMVDELKAMLDGSNRSTTSSTKKRPIRDDEDKEILIRTNQRGGVVPFEDRSFPVESNKRTKKPKLVTHRDGERIKYFHDDDQKTLETLVREEKLSRGESDLDTINRMVGKGIRGLGDDETVDDEMLRNESKHKPSKTFSKQKQMAIIEQQKMSSKIADCSHCFKNLQKHLIISMGTKAVLCLPRNKSMVPGHCLIVTLQHVVQSTVCDEDVLDEIKMYKRGLVRMFQENDEDVVFMETCKNLKSYPHLVIECIPVPKEIGDVAPISFQKAINECGPEWCNNKKLVTIKGGIKRSIPPGFPYFRVDFGLDDGYGHVIEDEEGFPWYFGREIVGGLLDLEPTLWRRPRFDDFEEQRKKVVEFAKTFKSFDPMGDLKKTF